ncbi:hypothetical protein B484DRAFT_462329, partial [Ochromonadaceae sp. CCMP2298]
SAARLLSHIHTCATDTNPHSLTQSLSPCLSSFLPPVLRKDTQDTQRSPPLLCSSAADMDFPFERAREFLGGMCDPQLRLVSRRCRDALAAVPREMLRIEDYISSAWLFVWATGAFGMPRMEIAPIAASGGHLEVLQLLAEEEGYMNRHVEWSTRTCSFAAAGGQLEVLEWLRAQDPPCPWGISTGVAAARVGHLHVLEWLRAQDPPCPWSEETSTTAAAEGQLEVLKWLRAQDPPCPWGANTCTTAANYGRTEVLEWLRAQVPPCEWTIRATTYAAKRGHLATLQWMRAQNPPCPWSTWTSFAAAEHGCLEVL